MDGKSGVTRSLVVLDRDSGDSRLLQPLKLKIREGDSLAGKVGSLRDAVVELAITRIDQGERTKDLGIAGHVVAVTGAMAFKPASEVKKVA
ncbi:MAG: hypothetical protein WC003_15490 [Terrimicrobiaceae bacterium]